MGTSADLMRQLGMTDTLPIAGGVGSSASLMNSLGILSSAEIVEEEKDSNPILSFGAGAVRGVLEPFTLLPPINSIVDKLKKYSGDDIGSKIGYGLGFVGGMLIPGTAAYKLTASVPKMVLGAKAMTIGVRAAEMTKRAKLVHGAAAGALFGAGRHAEDFSDWTQNVLTDAALGGVGDVVIPAAFGALAARFGKNPVPGLEEMILQAKVESTSIGEVIVPLVEPNAVAVAAHARAMSLMDVLGGSADQDMSGRLLNLKLGLEKLDLPTLKPGEMRIIPADDGADELLDIINQSSDGGLLSQILEHKGQKSIISGLREGFDEGVIKEFQEHGFMRGQSAMYAGSEWIVLKPAKGGMMLTQAGRLKKPIFAKTEKVALLPIVDDITAPARISQVGPVAAKFISEYGLWPGAYAGELGIKPAKGFSSALAEFMVANDIGGIDKLNVQDYLVKLQRRAIELEDPGLGKVIRGLDDDVSKSHDLPHADGVVEELATARGFVIHKQLLSNGSYGFVAKSEAGQNMSTVLNEFSMIKWLASHQGKIANKVDLPTSDNLVPSVGTTSQKAHNAIEFNATGLEIGARKSLFSNLMPQAKFFQWVEDQLVRAGNTTLKPFTQFFQPISQGRIAMQNQLETFINGGVGVDGKSYSNVKKMFDGIRADKRTGVNELIIAPENSWKDAIEYYGLNAKEVDIAKQARALQDDVWDRTVATELGISRQDFIDDYWRHFRNGSNEDAKKVIVQLNEGNVNEAAVDFADKMSRKGLLKKFDSDPMASTINFTRAALYRQHMDKAVDDALGLIRAARNPRDPITGKAILDEAGKVPKLSSEEEMLVSHMENYVRLGAYGNPESMSALDVFTRKTMEKMGIQLKPDEYERLLNTMITMNYGAFMAFRPGLVIRNLTQTIFTTYPLLGGKYTTYGFKRAMARNYDDAMKEVYDVGAVIGGGTPMPGQQMMQESIGTALEPGAANTAGKVFVKGADAITGASNWGLSWFRKADNLNRTVAYFGQKQKMMDAFNRLHTGVIDEKKFFKESGLNYFGDALKAEFKAKGFSGAEEAGKWLGVEAAHSTQWLYQLGAGPSMFSEGLGRIGGQYGTFASWYGSYLAQGTKNLKGTELAVFLARNAVAHKVPMVVMGAAGINIGRWTGLSSLGWMGGPAVDWAADLRDIVTGVQQSGEPTAQRQVALSQYGMKDDGEGLSMLPNTLDFIPGVDGRIGINKPARTALSFFGPLMPGYLALRDIIDMTQQDNIWEASAELLNLPMENPGYDKPAIRIR